LPQVPPAFPQQVQHQGAPSHAHRGETFPMPTLFQSIQTKGTLIEAHVDTQTQL
jgi:hypothetical protein